MHSELAMADDDIFGTRHGSLYLAVRDPYVSIMC